MFYRQDRVVVADVKNEGEHIIDVEKTEMIDEMYKRIVSIHTRIHVCMQVTILRYVIRTFCTKIKPKRNRITVTCSTLLILFLFST